MHANFTSNLTRSESSSRWKFMVCVGHKPQCLDILLHKPYKLPVSGTSPYAC